MNKKVAIKIINQELETLKDITADFSTNAQIHPMEIELALSKTTDIYNLLLLLQNPNDTKSRTPIELANRPSSQINSVTEAQKTEEEEEEEAKVEPITEEIKEDYDESIGAEEPSITAEVEPESTPTEIAPEETKEKVETEPALSIDEEMQFNDEQLVEVETEEPSEEPEMAKEDAIIETQTFKEQTSKESDLTQSKDSGYPKDAPQKKNGILADKFSENALSVNDMISSLQNNKNLAATLKERPVTELKKSIKINDKIWYIQELFEKNSELYDETINHLEKQTDINDALNYLFEKFEWDQNKKSTVNFIELVYRRFSNK